MPHHNSIFYMHLVIILTGKYVAKTEHFNMHITQNIGHNSRNMELQN